MPRAANGDLTLEYDEAGDPTGPVILLIMGLGAQLTAWRDGFRDLLVEQGHRVIRFDNRDAGLSSKTESTPPGLRELVPLLVPGPRRWNAPYTPPYNLSDMAADAIAVLDAAGVDRADVVGSSLGGMIAQTLAIEHPDRVRSLTSIMSKTGAPGVGLPRPAILRNVIRTRPQTRTDIIEHDLARSQLIAGPHFDRDQMREYLEFAFDRCYHPAGFALQTAAMLASGDRTKALRRLRLPTLVIHGRVDPLVGLSGGEATAKAIVGSKLVVHNDMGHDLPRPLWASLVNSIASHARMAAHSEHRDGATPAIS